MNKVDMTTGYCILFSSLFSFVAIVATVSRFRIKNLISADETYVSSRGSVSCMYITLSSFSSAMGSWILFVVPELGGRYGCWAVLLYALAASIPMWLILALTKHFRRVINHNSFSLSDYAKNRYGKVMEIIVQLASLFSMLISLAAELIFIGKAFTHLVDGIPTYATIISFSLVTLFLYFLWGITWLFNY